MLEILTVLTVLNMGIGATALTLAVLGRKGTRRDGVGAPYRAKEEAGAEEKKPLKLSDAKIQEGIDNLMSFQVGGRVGDE